MASQIVLAAALLGLCAIALTLRSLLKQAQQRRAAAAAGARIPPVVPGLPGLGSALALGRGGAAFLRRCRCKHGDAFSLALAGQRMTFVFAPAALQAYFSAPDSVLTFAPAVEQFTHRNFLLPPSAFAGKHATMLQVCSVEWPVVRAV